MGSVKDVTVIADSGQVSIMEFSFSDRYSVFDWGKMPDEIKNKGASLAVMSAFNFEELEGRGIKTHYLGLCGADDTMSTQELAEGGNGLDRMRVVKMDVHRPIVIPGEKPAYDYSFFQNNRGKINNYLVPLEIIFRNGLPLGSSVFKKIEKAKKIENPAEREAALQKIYSGLGLTSEPKPGDMLPKPIMSYTTKLEPGDRSLSTDEAYAISGLTEETFRDVQRIALAVDDFITQRAKRAGMEHYDGKIELGYFLGNLMVVDVVGTFDENRLGFNGKQVSKEFLRQWYKRNQPEFEPVCEEWKKTGEGWQQRCTVKPISLPTMLSTLVSQMYMAGCNRYIQKKVFEAPPLEEVMEKLGPYMG